MPTSPRSRSRERAPAERDCDQGGDRLASLAGGLADPRRKCSRGGRRRGTGSSGCARVRQGARLVPRYSGKSNRAESLNRLAVDIVHRRDHDDDGGAVRTDARAARVVRRSDRRDAPVVTRLDRRSTPRARSAWARRRTNRRVDVVGRLRAALRPDHSESDARRHGVGARRHRRRVGRRASGRGYAPRRTCVLPTASDR